MLGKCFEYIKDNGATCPATQSHVLQVHPSYATPLWESQIHHLPNNGEWGGVHLWVHNNNNNNNNNALTFRSIMDNREDINKNGDAIEDGQGT